ncbi:hypothetical protein LEMLEM_LOCUS15235, partial [Lemmus lemmus]
PVRWVSARAPRRTPGTAGAEPSRAEPSGAERRGGLRTSGAAERSSARPRARPRHRPAPASRPRPVPSCPVRVAGLWVRPGFGSPRPTGRLESWTACRERTVLYVTKSGLHRGRGWRWPGLGVGSPCRLCPFLPGARVALGVTEPPLSPVTELQCLQAGWLHTILFGCELPRS